jgi:tetratricopeptide (TPR) repeat protein
MSVIFRTLENVARPKKQDESIRAYRTSLMMATERSSGKNIVLIVIVSTAIIVLTVLVLLSIGYITTEMQVESSLQKTENPIVQSSIKPAVKGLVTVALNNEIELEKNAKFQNIQSKPQMLLSSNRYSIEKSKARFNELATVLKPDDTRTSLVVFKDNKIVDKNQKEKMVSSVNDSRSPHNDRLNASQLPKMAPMPDHSVPTKMLKPLTNEAIADERRFDGITVKVENNRQQVHAIVKKLKKAINQNSEQQVEQLFGELAQLKSEGSPYILKMRAYWYLKTKQYHSAKIILNQSLKISPSDVDIAINLALANLGLSQTQKAKRIVDEWLEKHPNNQQLIKLSKQIN